MDAAEAWSDRTMTTRTLLPTPVNNLLLDPFITSDTSWGHFRAVVPAVNPAETGGDCPSITREFLSASPIGISAPVVLVSQAVLPASTGCTAIISPFVGSTEAVSAQIWLSFSDASGAPLSFPPVTSSGAANVDAFVTVALVANALPSSTTAPASYRFTPASTPPTVISGRPWGLLELASPVAIPEGGWFAITITNPTTTVYLAAPQVVPATTTTLSVVRSTGAAARAITDVERGAMLQYGRLLLTPAPPRRRPRPVRVASPGP